MRIDKFLSNLKYGTRTEIKKMMKKNQVRVNNEVIKDPSMHIDPNLDHITILDEVVTYRENIYIMLNKPSGTISATNDQMHKTVIDLLSEDYKRYDLFPCGRLDIDTEGLMVLSNDGKFAHELIHPKKEIYKKYYVEFDGEIKNTDIIKFNEGLEILDGNNQVYITKEAKLELIENQTCYVYICEGKFHQIKRMFQKLGLKVTYLKRVQMGKLKLDSHLKLGEFREITTKELDLLFINENIFKEDPDEFL